MVRKDYYDHNGENPPKLSGSSRYKITNSIPVNGSSRYTQFLNTNLLESCRKKINHATCFSKLITLKDCEIKAIHNNYTMVPLDVDPQILLFPIVEQVLSGRTSSYTQHVID